jgi:hypothetical protein
LVKLKGKQMGKKKINWEKVGLGTKRDVDIAKDLGVSDSTVWKHRRELGIPRYDPRDNEAAECSVYCSGCSCDRNGGDDLEWIIGVQRERIDRWDRVEREVGLPGDGLTEAIQVFLNTLEMRDEK